MSKATIRYQIFVFDDDGTLVIPMTEDCEGKTYPLFFGYNFGYPSMEEALEAIDEYGEENIIYTILPLIAKGLFNDSF